MNYLPMNLTLYFITEITLIDIKKLWNKLIIPEQSAFTDQLILLYLYCYPLSSRLYCRLRNRTESQGGEVVGINTETLDGNQQGIDAAKKLLETTGASYRNIYFEIGRAHV